VSEQRYDDWQTPDGSDPDRATHVLAHLSDTHLTSPGVRYNGVLDADAALDRAVAVLRDAAAGGRQLDAVVLSGDLTDTGDPTAYRRLAGAVESIATPGNAPLTIYATGNHDVRTEFHRQLLHRDGTEPLLQVHTVRGLRVIVLDSTIVGAGHGRLTEPHLAELRAELRSTAPAGTILVLHHAPVPPPSPLLSYFALETASRRALSAAIESTDVRMILAGHHHLARSAMLGTVPVAVAGSTTIRTDPLAPAGHERTLASGSFNLIEVYPDTIVSSVIPVDGADGVFDLDSSGCRSIIQAHPID
jgi:3',5'-cyclic AMP phosphodiesterase CpdA